MQYTIREIEKYDLDDIESLASRSFSPEDYYEGYPKQLEWLIAKDERRYLLCAEDMCEIVGFISGGIAGEIEYLAVDDDYRSEGMGKRLVMEITKRLKEDGFDEVFLTPTRDSEKFYRKIGFETGNDGRMYADIEELLEDDGD
ncbi:MAG: GNAT family N-acetyltransferase [Candidatus Woesearchaeota archaeon]